MQKRYQETHTLLLNTSLDLFAKNGYDATGVAEICKAADVSKGAFYHHFKSKQEVFLTLLFNWLDQIDAQLAATRSGATDIPQALINMSGLMQLVFEQAGNHLPMFLEFWTQASHDPVIWQALIDPYQRYRVYFRDMIQAGIDEGSLKPVDPDLAAHTIVSLALGLLLQGLLDIKNPNWEKATSQSIILFLDGLRR
jgi:AcrR family transcriptional regulator